ncbi:HalOD1 output domain-containing protein [Salinibaculum rarum]|uniref:HalOD1 output domain-containing protein n=1 Tax=Salinibaculum rarum TaxID=3058903 RepID=UPI00265FFC94|nr:HalOD1 output domain-containing protein [Salinibaculum sp. KK48]
MSSEDGEVYVMRAETDEEWVSPKPVRTAITDALTEATALEESDIDTIESYVDLTALRGVLEGEDDDLTFDVEGHDVTVTADGDISVE